MPTWLKKGKAGVVNLKDPLSSPLILIPRDFWNPSLQERARNSDKTKGF